MLNMVCNARTMTDAQLIDALGGPAAVAKLLKLRSAYSSQRVHNWKKRGIPSKVMLEHRGVFARAEREQKALQAASRQEA